MISKYELAMQYALEARDLRAEARFHRAHCREQLANGCENRANWCHAMSIGLISGEI